MRDGWECANLWLQVGRTILSHFCNSLFLWYTIPLSKPVVYEIVDQMHEDFWDRVSLPFMKFWGPVVRRYFSFSKNCKTEIRKCDPSVSLSFCYLCRCTPSNVSVMVFLFRKKETWSRVILFLLLASCCPKECDGVCHLSVGVQLLENRERFVMCIFLSPLDRNVVDPFFPFSWKHHIV